MLHRIVTGTLSDIVGKSAVPIDRVSRRVGFHRSASKQYELMDEESRLYMSSYYSGITSGREIGCKKKAHEFSILRCDPSNYTPTDILGLLKVFAFQMGSNWDYELARFQFLILDDQQALVDLDPYYKGPDRLDKKVKSKDNANSKFERLPSDLNMFLDWMGKSGTSPKRYRFKWMNSHYRGLKYENLCLV